MKTQSDNRILVLRLSIEPFEFNDSSIIIVKVSLNVFTCCIQNDREAKHKPKRFY